MLSRSILTAAITTTFILDRMNTCTSFRILPHRTPVIHRVHRRRTYCFQPLTAETNPLSGRLCGDRLIPTKPCRYVRQMSSVGALLSNTRTCSRSSGRKRITTLSLSSSSSSSSISSSSSSSSSSLVPRAATSVVVRYTPPQPPTATSSSDAKNRYVLVQRGKEPRKGMWSLPGGKIEYGEKSIDAAKRELAEETGFTADDRPNNGGLDTNAGWNMVWSEEGPIAITDAISEGYHYVISQWFAELTCYPQTDDVADGQSGLEPLLPEPIAGDDADDARWWDLDEIERGIERGEVTRGVEIVIRRSEMLYEKGVL